MLVFMKVSELAERTGVSVHRLRRYEAQGLIHAQRSAGGYREFSPRTVREVIFIAMSRDLGFSLKAVSETVPSYRAGSLTFDQMIDHMTARITEVDAQIAAQHATRDKLVSHIAWLKKRKRENERSQRATPAPSWPKSTRKLP